MPELQEGIFNTLAEKSIVITSHNDHVINFDVWKKDANVDVDDCLCSIQIDLQNNKVIVEKLQFQAEIL